MSLKDFEILQELGKGAYGSVFKVRRKEDQEIYALKKVIVTKLNDREKENSINEIRILASINHPNVISYKEAFYDESSHSICTVMEFADDGDLEIKISQKFKSRTQFSEAEVWNMLFQIASGLKVLHEKKILHRDLKSANVFLYKNGQAKLGDLNVSKVNKKGLLYTQTGTPYYASPEVWKDKPYDYKSDIWSLGCVIYEMTTLKPPFRGNTMEQVYNKVIRGSYDAISHTYSHSLSTMIGSLLQVNPGTRPSCEQIINMIVNKKKVNSPEKNRPQSVDVNALLQTIKMPRDLKQINGTLPKSAYKKKMLLEEQKKNKSFNGENSVQKIIETSFINKSENVMTEPALPYNARTNSNEKLNSSDIACDIIKEKNKILKKKISIKEKQLADLSTPNHISIKNIYNIKGSVPKGVPFNPSYIVEQEINKGINNINNHNNIIIQNNIQNVIKGPYELPKYNAGQFIPISPVIQDLRYRPVILSENKIAKIQNIAPYRASPPANVPIDLKQKFKINRPLVTPSRNLEVALQKNSPSLPLDQAPSVKYLQNLRKQQNSPKEIHNLSLNEKAPIPRIQSSNIHKRNKENLFRNDNSINAQSYSINQSISQNKEVIAGPLSIVPLNPVKKNRLIFDNCVRNNDLYQPKDLKLEILSKKQPLVIPKISSVSPNMKVSPNKNGAKIAWRI